MPSLQALLPGLDATRIPPQPDIAEPQPETAIDWVRQAIINNTVSLAYQPVVFGKTPGKTAFYEALIRVPDRAGEIIPAAAFVPHVEDNSLGRMLDCCALEQGIAELAAQPWLRLAVNASPKSIIDPLWQATLRSAVAPDPTLAERLIVEITETTQVADMAEFAEQVNAVRAQGVSFALDDFGAGYTSFRILKEARFDIIKIDGHLIRDIHKDRDSQALTQALIGIARHFEMLVVAEAVESRKEMAYLQGLGVDCMQGYLFGRPETLPAWSEKQALSGLP